nr:MAG TPA: hypothetical protein [Caudoviricetes sp.]
MIISKKEKDILEKRGIGVYEQDTFYELEQWTNGGVNMFINIWKEEKSSLVEQLERYIDEFDIDNEIDMYRQDEDYKSNFTITRSLEDFGDWLEYIKSIIEDLKKEGK